MRRNRKAEAILVCAAGCGLLAAAMAYGADQSYGGSDNVHINCNTDASGTECTRFGYGEAGSSSTEVMRVTNSGLGELLIGRTSARQEWADKVNVQGSNLVVTDGTADFCMSAASGGTLGTRTNHPVGISTNNTTRIYIEAGGDVEIGTTGSADEKLHVRGNIKAGGKIIADSIRVQRVCINSWSIEVPDYVFEPGYKLRPLAEVEHHVQTAKHLPEMPSGAELKEGGVDLAELNMALLRKVEELTLYAIAQEKRIAALESVLRTQGAGATGPTAQERE